MGEQFFLVKQKLAHGEFQPWSEKNVADFSYQTVRNYMSIYALCKSVDNPDLVQHFTMTVLLKMGSDDFPQELKEYLVSNARRLQRRIGEQQVTMLLDKLKNGGVDPDDPAVEKLYRKTNEDEERKRHIDQWSKHLSDFTDIKRRLVEFAGRPCRSGGSLINSGSLRR